MITEKTFMVHLRFGVILTDNMSNRYIIARQSTEDYPVVFLRQWDDDPWAEGDYYSLYGSSALTTEKADDILTLLQSGETRKARTLFKRHFKDNDPYCDYVGPVVLDDMIPDDWYDAWKQMESIISSTKHITGYWEYDFEAIKYESE